MDLAIAVFMVLFFLQIIFSSDKDEPDTNPFR